MFFISTRTIENAKMMVTEMKAREAREERIDLTTEEVREVRTAEAVVGSAVHPQTGETIPRLMRLCSYSIMSIPVQFGMLLSAPTPFNIIFW